MCLFSEIFKSKLSGLYKLFVGRTTDISNQYSPNKSRN